MTKSNDRLNHALHNEAVCDYLEIKIDFVDWVITTAFYSALQFVSYKIFPFEVAAIGGKKTKIESLNDYHRYQSHRKLSKHELLADLVEINCNKISPDYDWLLSMSMNARYSNYQQEIEIGNKARTLMKKIKKFCIA